MDKTFTASEVRELAEWLSGVSVMGTGKTCHMLHDYADLLEAREKAVPVAWSLIFEESIGVNAPTTYNRREDAEDYADACAMPDKCNPFPHRPKVVPLYTHPTPADADRLAEQRDDAFQQAVQEARRVWMDEFPCEAGHDHVTPFDQFLYGNRPCMEAQPPAASVADAVFPNHRACVPYENHPGKRIVGFVIDESHPWWGKCGLTEPLSALEAALYAPSNDKVSGGGTPSA